LVEAGGQHFRGFRRGLDYAFIHTPRSVDAERVIRPASAQVRILVPARGPRAVGESMSLYRAGLKLALFLPLGVAMPPSIQGAVRFHRCELRFQPGLTAWCDPLIEPPSASP